MSSGAAPAVRGEIRALTGLRIVAAMWVVVIHFQGDIPASMGAVLGPVWPIAMAGWLGVDLFFLLSGFVMTISYLDRLGPRWDTRAVVGFLWARLIRIWPLWALLTVLMFGFLLATGWDSGPAEHYHRQATLGGLVEQLGLFQMWYRDLNLGSSFVPPGWSLSVEFLAYLSFPFLVLGVFRLRRLPAVVLAMLAVAAMLPLAFVVYKTGQGNFLLPWQVRIGGAFLSGSLTCLFVERVKNNATIRRISPFIAACAVVEILMVCYWGYFRITQQQPDHLGLAVVFFPVLVGALALSDRGVAGFLSRETMVVGGRISFALYLVHVVVLDFVHYAMERFPQFAFGSPGGTMLQVQLIPLSLLASWILWRYVEEPCRLWLRFRGPGRLVRPAVASEPRPEVAPAAAAGRGDRVAVPRPEHVRPSGRPSPVPAPVADDDYVTARLPLPAEPRRGAGRPPVPREGTDVDLLRV